MGEKKGGIVSPHSGRVYKNRGAGVKEASMCQASRPIKTFERDGKTPGSGYLRFELPCRLGIMSERGNEQIGQAGNKGRLQNLKKEEKKRRYMKTVLNRV